MRFKLFFFLPFLGLLLLACSNDKVQVTKQTFSSLKASVKYAKRFSIQPFENYTLVHVFGNKHNFDTTATYQLYKNENDLKTIPIKGIQVKIPCQKIAALSSIYANMFVEVSSLQTVIAIDNIDYITSASIREKHTLGKLPEVAKGPEPDIEKLIALQPDMVFMFGMGNPDKDVPEKCLLAKIPVAISIDHLEETPLARAEWIRFFAAFVDKDKKADSIFASVEKNYLSLKILGKQVSTIPSVFSELKYSDTWYVPGGRSFMAQLFADAGADYVWRTDSGAGSIPLSFEQVYTQAKDADFWVNLSMVQKKEELLLQEPRYDQFAAFKKGNLFNNNKNTNAAGYSDYWETGMIHPDRILEDLLQIFHPELKKQIKNDLYYYRQIN